MRDDRQQRSEVKNLSYLATVPLDAVYRFVSQYPGQIVVQVGVDEDIRAVSLYLKAA
jgi:hypothetical protein